MGVKLEVGKSYLMHCGELARVIDYIPYLNAGYITDKGRYSEDGKFYACRKESPYDLSHEAAQNIDQATTLIERSQGRDSSDSA